MKDKFKYWFDNEMAKGSLTLIKFLILVTIIIVLLITGGIFLLGANDDASFIYVLWESFSTVVNAWMPSSEDGSLIYVIFMAIAAISGLMVTSVLIGIFTSAIEEKINNLKLGNSIVMEENHIVILGFNLGEYTLLNELILSCDDEPTSIVIASDYTRDEIEEAIRDNCDIPKNIHIICRTVDIFDPVALEKCSIPKARSIVISTMEDYKVIKTVLAITKLMEEYDKDVEIIALVNSNDSILPESFMKKNHIKMLQYNQTIAKIIAHACSQPGISEVYQEMLDYDGYNFYVHSIPDAIGMTFMELTLKMNHGTALGIYKKNACLLNPDKDTIIEEGDKILFMALHKKDVQIHKESEYLEEENKVHYEIKHKPFGKIGIIGVNDQLNTIIDELSDDISELCILGDPEEIGMNLSNDNLEKVEKVDTLEEICDTCQHVVILSPTLEEDDEADYVSMSKILNLRDIRERKNLDFNITAEMRKENNQMLINNNDTTDFIVASNMSSLFLAQLCQNPVLYPVFQEILSNKGNELYIRSAAELHCLGKFTMEKLRKMALLQGYIILAFMDDEHQHLPIEFNLNLEKEFNLKENDRFVVLSNE